MVFRLHSHYHVRPGRATAPIATHEDCCAGGPGHPLARWFAAAVNRSELQWVRLSNLARPSTTLRHACAIDPLFTGVDCWGGAVRPSPGARRHRRPQRCQARP